MGVTNARHRRHQDRRRASSTRMVNCCIRIGNPPRAAATPNEVWAAAERTIAEALAAAGGTVDGVGISSAGPIHLDRRHHQPGQHRRLARLPGARPRGRRGARCAGAAGRRRAVHGTRRALARRGAGRGVHAWHGDLHRVSAAASCSTARPTTGAPATPATSGTWSSTPTGRAARAADAGVWRPSPADRIWWPGRGGRAGPERTPRSWPPTAAAGDAVALRGLSTAARGPSRR